MAKNVLSTDQSDRKSTRLLFRSIRVARESKQRALPSRCARPPNETVVWRANTRKHGKKCPFDRSVRSEEHTSALPFYSRRSGIQAEGLTEPLRSSSQ